MLSKRFFAAAVFASASLTAFAEEKPKTYWVFECKNTTDDRHIAANEPTFEWVYQFKSNEDRLSEKFKNWCFKWTSLGTRCKKVVNRESSAVVTCHAGTLGQVAVTP